MPIPTPGRRRLVHSRPKLWASPITSRRLDPRRWLSQPAKGDTTIIARAGAVSRDLIRVADTWGNAAAISDRAGAMAALANTVSRDMDSSVSLSMAGL